MNFSQTASLNLNPTNKGIDRRLPTEFASAPAQATIGVINFFKGSVAYLISYRIPSKKFWSGTGTDMAKDFTTRSFIGRWLFAAGLVFGTYNPSGYSYVGWLLAESTTFGPVLAIVGLMGLIAWIIYLRATFLSMGMLGVSLGAALFAAVVWLLVDLGWLSIDSTGVLAYLVLILLSILLAMGMSWSHLRRRLTGQVDVDDVER